MKKVIRWLSDISGVTSQIEKQTAIRIGYNLQDFSYWFTGGLKHKKPLKNVANAYFIYSEKVLKKGDQTLYGNQFDHLRGILYDMQEKDELIFDNPSKYE